MEKIIPIKINMQRFIGNTLIAIAIIGVLIELFSIAIINYGCFGGYYMIKTMFYCFWDCSY